MIPFLVSRDDLQAANGFEQLSAQSSNFAGPAVAGAVLAATQLAFGLVIDAASFAVSVFTLLFVRVAPLADAWGELRAGREARVARRPVGLRRCVSATCVGHRSCS